MTTRRITLPPLPALIAFEAAARHLSFKNASEELQVTPSAVSQHIKNLESELGTSLFNRRNRAVELTAQGQHLHEVLRGSLTQVATALDEIRDSENRRPVTIHATTAMSALWLTPRLSAFWKEHSDIAVNQHVSDLPPPRGETFDLQIWYGAAPMNDPRYQLLFRDKMVPVCSPGFQKQAGIDSLEILAAQPLIHLDATTDWTNWQAFFNAHDFKGEIGNGPSVNNYSIAVQSARDSVGVLLGWEKLLAPLIKRGLLVALDEFSLPAPGSFYLVSPHSEPLRDSGRSARVLHDWLITR